MNITKNLGDLLLAIFLILFGLLQFFSFQGADVILAVLALAAGILKLLGR